MPRNMTSLSPTTVDSFETSIKEASKTPQLFGSTKHGRSGLEKIGGWQGKLQTSFACNEIQWILNAISSKNHVQDGLLIAVDGLF